MNAKNRLIVELDQAAHRLGITLTERGLNRRILSLLCANAIWDITDDGDKLKIRSTCPNTSILLWEERHPVAYVIEVLEAIARRRGRGGNAS